MKLNRFKKLRRPLKASTIAGILSKNMVFNKAEKKIDYDHGVKIWDSIIENCI